MLSNAYSLLSTRHVRIALKLSQEKERVTRSLELLVVKLLISFSYFTRHDLIVHLATYGFRL